MRGARSSAYRGLVYPADVVSPPQCHAISFFEDQEQLCDDIATFIAEGLNVGEPALIVTNEVHRTGIVDELRARGVHAAERMERGDLLLLDAEEALITLIKSDGLPDAALYHETVGSAVKQLLDGRPGPVRIFGDMVDLLWQRGEYEAAIRIEILSNQLALVEPISVICGYSMGHFLKTAAKLESVRHLHGRVHQPRAGRGSLERERADVAHDRAARRRTGARSLRRAGKSSS